MQMCIGKEKVWCHRAHATVADERKGNQLPGRCLSVPNAEQIVARIRVVSQVKGETRKDESEALKLDVLYRGRC